MDKGGRTVRLVFPVASLAVAAGPAWGSQPQDPRGALVLLLLLPAALLVLVALELVLWILAPGPLVATARAIERGRGRCLLMGIAATLTTLALLWLCNRFPAAGKTAAPLLVGIVGLGCLTGIAAVVASLGQGALDLAGRSGSRAATVIVGAVLLGLVVLVPFVGQVLGIYFVLVGLGGALRAAILSLRGRK